MISLYTTPSIWGLPSISPACMKLETWFRIANISYETLVLTANDIELAPKGKMPFIKYQGKIIGDSTLIIEMLKEKEGIDLDKSLTATERAISLAFRRMLKENTYWGMAYIRYNVEANWQIYQEVLANMLFGDTPKAEWEPIVAEFANSTRAQIYTQGMGRHTNEEICQIITADFQALSDFLADKPFFMGAEATTLDATAYAYVGNTIKLPLTHSIIDNVRKMDNLCQHYERMTQRFYRDRLVPVP
ncbi:glutathione S-transferase family protein [Calothrix sp. FACHB-1219]|uniref:glutathione S-transferase family protein n=1 Tax=unclassified Calothrix TaxID=2619626 RepID=UPI0016898C30|nr:MULTISPECIES: glutathione S-transferase family protein [unclassified Calothrix]MBD2207510.1 glutathione S-transferase family protein [Calothrix sp. FACHB-168]MBD2222111.1 glutathione S-transferase family protein [Calothrix sp. FACHB-1219]